MTLDLSAPSLTANPLINRSRLFDHCVVYTARMAISQVEPRGRRIRGIWLAALALLVSATVGGTLWLRSTKSGAAQGMELLVEALASRRLIQGRLSGGFCAGSYDPEANGANALIGSPRLESATEAILSSLTLRKDREAQLALGRLFVATRPRDPEALRHVRSVTKQFPDSPEAHNDLGVCLLELGDVERALEEFNLALSSRPRMPEPLFNRALCYNTLSLVEAEKSDLMNLISLERDPAWLAEARKRLEVVQQMSKLSTSLWNRDQPIVEFNAAFADHDLARAGKVALEGFEFIRPYALFDLTIKYLKAAAQADLVRASSRLSKLEFLAKIYAESKGDRAVEDCTQHLRSLDSASAQEELRLMKEFQQGALLLRGTDAEKTRGLQILNSLITQGQNNDLLTRAIYDVLQAHYYSSEDYDLQVATIQKGLTLIQGKQWLRERAAWLNGLGSANLRQGKDSVAIDYFKQVMEIARNMGERPLEAKVLQLQGVVYWHVGDLGAALARFRESTSILYEVSPLARELAYNYVNVADIYSIKRDYSLAIKYAEEASRFAGIARDQSRAAQALSLAAVAKARAGKTDEAVTTLEEALAKMNNPGTSVQALTRRLVLSRGGEIAIKLDNFVEAIRYYTESERLAVSAKGDVLQRISALSGRADAYTLSGRNEEAQRDLSEALNVIESYRAQIRESEYRSSFLDVSQSVFDQRILLQASNAESVRDAFNTSEDSKARAFLDRLTPLESPVRLEKVQEALPSGLVMLAFSVTPKSTFVFVVTNSGFQVRKSSLTTGETEAAVYEYLSLIREQAPIEELKERAATLYDGLIGPVRDLLPEGSEVCIVPDKTLHYLPFAALFDESGRYFIERHSVTIAPSASVFVTCLRNARRRAAAGPEKMLAVGNPSFDQERFPHLQRLPDAEVEAVKAAGYYKPNAIVLRGAQAKPREVLAAITDAHVIHLASHALVEEGSSWQPALLLSPDPTMSPGTDEFRLDGVQAGHPSGLLYLEGLFDRRMPRSRLVVLSACDSGLGRYYRGEGIVSLVRPFITSGVPTVVASLWKIDSTATGVLAVELHRIRTQVRVPVCEALRQAQFRMASGDFGEAFRHPYYWASFIVAGSGQ